MVSISLIIFDSAHNAQAQELMKSWKRLMNMQAGDNEAQGQACVLDLELRGVTKSYQVHTGACVMGGEDVMGYVENWVGQLKHLNRRYKRLAYAVVASMNYPDQTSDTIKAWGVHGALKSEWRPDDHDTLVRLAAMAGQAEQAQALLEAVAPFIIEVPALARVRSTLQSQALEHALPKAGRTNERKPRM